METDISDAIYILDNTPLNGEERKAWATIRTFVTKTRGESKMNEGLFLVDRADGAKGHFCIGRKMPMDNRYVEYFNKGEWCAFGEVFTENDLINAVLNERAKSPPNENKIKQITPNGDPVPDLLGADPNCDHNIVSAPGGGVKCTKCPGWFCY